VPSTGAVCLLDPGRSDLKMSEAATRSWSKYMEARNTKAEEQIDRQWFPVTQGHSRQMDSFNCGLIVIAVRLMLGFFRVPTRY